MPILDLTAHLSKVRLDKYLADEIEVLSRSKARECIESDNVSVDGKREKPSYMLKGGESIRIELPVEPPLAVEGENIPLDIIHEDDELIVINKPAGLVVHPGAGNIQGTLVNALVYHFTRLSSVHGDRRPGIVHRLDKDTSGVLVVAKTDQSHMHVAKQFSSHSVEKTYWGVVWGKFDRNEGVVEGPITRHPRDRKKFAVVEYGRRAVTRYWVEREFDTLTLVGLMPVTGRTHQLRVHMAHVGHPVFADEIYGGGKSRLKGYSPHQRDFLISLYSSIQRQALHALSITVVHPKSRKGMTFEAPVPADFQTVIDTLERRHG
ncbi:MAG: RluA family pseudouridine synthase [Candidatus Neomarinimicrobiota bacterium]